MDGTPERLLRVIEREEGILSDLTERVERQRSRLAVLKEALGRIKMPDESVLHVFIGPHYAPILYLIARAYGGTTARRLPAVFADSLEWEDAPEDGGAVVATEDPAAPGEFFPWITPDTLM